MIPALLKQGPLQLNKNTCKLMITENCHSLNSWNNLQNYLTGINYLKYCYAIFLQLSAHQDYAKIKRNIDFLL